MNWEYDVLLISPWTEPINILPNFHIARKEVEIYSQRLNEARFPQFFLKHTNQDENILKYYTKIPISTGLLSIAKVLKVNGYKCRYISLDYYKDESDPNWLFNVLRIEVPKTKYLVCVTACTPELFRAFKTLDMVKKLSPDLLCAIGGPHVSVMDEEALRHQSVDIVSRGEGEITTLELTNAIKNGQPWKDIQGISYKDKNRIVRNSDRPMMDLSELPIPDYELLPRKDMDKFIFHTFFSRGCYNHCDYCVEGGYWGSRKRFRNVDSFVEEIKLFATEYNWRFIHIFDSDFIAGNKYIHEICDRLEEMDLDIMLSINCSPDLYKMIDLTTLKRMNEVGFKEFLIGCETADDQLLHDLNRKQHIDELIKSIKLLNEAKIPMINTYWIVGLPGETRKSISKTIETIVYLLENDLVYHVSAKLFTPYPGTEVYKNSEKYGIQIISHDWEMYDRYNFPPPYIHSNLTPLELQSYITLIHAIQCSYFIKRTASQIEHADRLSKMVPEYYIREIYL